MSSSPSVARRQRVGHDGNVIPTRSLTDLEGSLDPAGNELAARTSTAAASHVQTTSAEFPAAVGTIAVRAVSPPPPQDRYQRIATADDAVADGDLTPGEFAVVRTTALDLHDALMPYV